MIVLGIESTCDETACAIVRNGSEILSNVVTSQIMLHAEYGGVVPELACRRHVDTLVPVIDEAIKKAQISLQDINLIAVANGPGLIGALLLGLNAAKSLSLALNKPLIGVNHIEAHLHAALMSHATPPTFPCLGVVLSGGHTSLFLMQEQEKHTLVSQTVDDAIGEAFDKVAKMLGLAYPGGPIIEALAAKGDPSHYSYRAGQVKGNPLAFSFSGLKTAVLYSIQGRTLTESDKQNVAAAFQEAALSDIVKKTLISASKYRCQTLVFGGGVTYNKRLRKLFAEAAPHLRQLWPAEGLILDNAAMIAGLGYRQYQERGCGDSLHLEPFTR